MKKIFNKVLAGITATALVATLLVGINVTNTVKADDTVTLVPWSFYQGGAINKDKGEYGNAGLYTNVTTSTGEVLNSFPAEAAATINAKSAADGFTAEIANTGWDQVWETGSFNPWSVTAVMDGIALLPGHDYTVTFTVSATPDKYALFTMANQYGESVVAEGDETVIVMKDTAATYTYKFTNWAASETLKVSFMMGAFGATKDYAGNDKSSVMVNGTETSWAGTVNVTNFVVTDNGQNKDYVPDPTKATAAPTTAAPTTPNQGGNVVAPTTAAPTTPAPVVATKLDQVKIKKAKNTGAGKVKITWKKVTNAVQYKVKVGKKTYKTKKTKLTVKKLAVGTYKIKVRALKTKGFKAGAWSKAKKVKVTK